jgi:hypothetical protein
MDAEFVDELSRDIVDEVRTENWTEVRADLTALADHIVGVLLDRRDPDIRATYMAVERAYSILATIDGPAEDKCDAQSAVLELQAFTRLLSVALQHKKPLEFEVIADDLSNRKILSSLFTARSGLSGLELAKKSDLTPETIARKLPLLRACGLVETRKAGRMAISKLSLGAVPLVQQASWAGEPVSRSKQPLERYPRFEQAAVQMPSHSHSLSATL